MIRALLFLAAFQAQAAERPIWYRWEAFGLGIPYQSARGGDIAVYDGVSGFGIGTSIVDRRFLNLQVTRTDGGVVTGRVFGSYLPVNVYWTLWSKGGPLWPMPKFGSGDIARLELFGSFSDWARLENFDSSRGSAVNGMAYARSFTSGVRFDLGRGLAFEAGHIAIKLKAHDRFLARRVPDRWFAEAHLYLGKSGGGAAGGGGIVWLRAILHRIFIPFKPDPVE